MYSCTVCKVAAILVMSGTWIYHLRACIIYTAKTDNCAEYFYPCGDGYCCCSNNTKTIICSGFGHQLQYIPYMTFQIKLLYQNNYLTRISERTFSNISQPSRLNSLILCNNSITEIEPEAFQTLSLLQRLDLSGNFGINLTQLALSFSKLRYLQTLHLQNAGLTYLNKNFFRYLSFSRLLTLSLSGNNFALLDLSFFSRLTVLKTLKLDNCSITAIRMSVVLPRLEFLYLSHNRLTNSPPTFCQENSTNSALPNLRVVSLINNLFYKLDDGFLHCLHTIESIKIGGNMLSTLKNNTFARFSKLAYLFVDNLEPHLKLIEPLAFQSQSLRKLSLFNNNIKFRKGHNIHSLKCLGGLNELVISHNNFYKVPVTILSDIFSSLANLQKLTCGNCRITYINSGLLINMPNLAVINLYANKISKIDGAFDQSKKLKHIIMKDNKIKNVKATDFSINLFKSLDVLDLRRNPFVCTCDLMWFRNVIGETGVIANHTQLAKWPESYFCLSSTNGKSNLLHDFRPTEEFCSESNIFKTVVVVLAMMIFLAICLTAVAYRKRWHLCYWFYKLKLKIQPVHLERESLPQSVGSAYDAYIIYHENDSEFTHCVLPQLLEGGLNYKLHIWQRDAVHGSKLEVMFDAIYSSRAVIGVVSTHFLQDSYCNFQLEVAIDRDIIRKQEGVFLILLDDIDYKTLDRYWCVVLTRTPSGTWCSDCTRIERNVFDQTIERFMRKIKRNKLIADPT